MDEAGAKTSFHILFSAENWDYLYCWTRWNNVHLSMSARIASKCSSLCGRRPMSNLRSSVNSGPVVDVVGRISDSRQAPSALVPTMFDA